MSENTKKTLEELAAKDPTDLHVRFAEWMEEKTGIKPDLKTVQLACIFRMTFQSSPENQKALQDRKAEAARRKKESAARKRAKLEAELAKLKAQESEATEPAAEVQPASTPAAKKAVSKSTPAKAATAPRTRRATAPKAVKAAPAPVEDDFDRVDDETQMKPAPRARRTRRTATTK